MSEVKAIISGAHVYCHVLRTDRDIEKCFGCQRLKEFRDESSPPYIVCDTTGIPALVQSDPLFVSWWYQHHRRGR